MRAVGGALALTVLVAAGLAAGGSGPQTAPPRAAGTVRDRAGQPDRDVRGAAGSPDGARAAPDPAMQQGDDAWVVLAHGRRVYEASCARCHGGGGEGRSGCCCKRGPPLAGSGLTRWQIRAATRHGMPGMPAFGGRLSEAEIKAVAAYVQALAAGRPAE